MNFNCLLKINEIKKQTKKLFIRRNFREFRNSRNFLDKLLRIDECKKFREINFRGDKLKINLR